MQQTTGNEIDVLNWVTIWKCENEASNNLMAIVNEQQQKNCEAEWTVKEVAGETKKVAFKRNEQHKKWCKSILLTMD